MGIFDWLLGRAQAQVEPTKSAEPLERRRSQRTSAAHGMTVLIVDDSKTIVTAIGKMLRENKIDVIEAFDGEAALEILDGVKVDLMFLDIVLPGMTGFEVLRRLRRNPKINATRVIIMSGNEAATEEYYVKRIGADEFMKKPFSRAQVFATLERVLKLPKHTFTG